MTSSAAIALAAIVLSLSGLAGIVAGIFWRRQGYHIPSPFRIAGLCLSVLAVWLVLDQTHRLKVWGAVMQWPSVEGTVITSRVAGERALHPEIVYEYSVAGSTFRDSTGFDTPSFGGKSVKQDVAEAIVAKFPSGSRVAVHYNPEMPSQSLLRLSPDWSLYGKIGLGGVLFGLGLFLIAAARTVRL